MSGYNFEIKGIDNFLKGINKIQSNFHSDLQSLIEKHGGKLWKNAKNKTPVDTGQLKTGWQLEKGDLYVKVFNNTKYGIYVEYGHRIIGRDGKVKGVVEGVYMLKTSFEKTKQDFENDLEKLFKKYGFK